VSVTTSSDVEIGVSTGERMPTLLVEAGRDVPKGSILVVGDIGGARREFIDMIAERLAAEGYDAIVPEFFFREGPLAERTREAIIERRGRLDDVQVIADLGAAVDWLCARPRFHGERVGTIGFCLGGTFVLNLAAARDDLATICYYGFPAETPVKAGVQGPYPRDEVDRVSGPVLAFWGTEDERAGQENIAAYLAAMEKRDIDFEATVYPGLDHAFLMTEWEAGAGGHDLAMDSWRRSLEFFAEGL
jgi:carboxymethylenebutenolidase